MTAIYWAPLLFALTAFVVLWPISVRKQDASIVDFVWAPGFVLQISVALALFGALDARAALVLCLVLAWSIRLSRTLIGRRLREGHEDPRYTSLRQSWGPSFWWKSLFVVFALQAVLQWLVVLGAIAAATASGQVLGWAAWAGVLLAISGIALEAVADLQLDRFKQSAGPGKLLTTGLRRYVRHPNYSGEILFWVGIAVIGLEGGAWLALISPILMAALLVLVSGAPMLDERLSETRAGYDEYRSRTPGFFPRLSGLFRRRQSDARSGG